MSQLSRVAKVLRKNTKSPGITASAIAKAAGVPRTSVAKRISDLRNVEGHTIYSNFRTVNGTRKMFYRLAS